MLLEEFERLARQEQNFDKALSKLIAEQLKQLPRGGEYLSNVEEFLKQIEKELVFDITDTKYADFKAQTREFKKSILVTLKRDIKEEELLTVLIHELGEVDYLARRLPIVSNEKEDEVHGRLIELFSHPHARHIARDYELDEIEGEFRNTEVLKLIEDHNQTDYKNNVEVIIKICWLLSTYPKLLEHREQLNGYIQNKDKINLIHSIIEETDTFGVPEMVELSMEKVISILKSINLPEYIVMKKRNGESI
jgi:HPt (histidine-containing phosphotransfer) domain-containing protein